MHETYLCETVATLLLIRSYCEVDLKLYKIYREITEMFSAQSFRCVLTNEVDTYSSLLPTHVNPLFAAHSNWPVLSSISINYKLGIQKK